MRTDNFVVIQGWMRTELNLKGNDLFVYAIIYGFSQTENQRFTGSLQYLADWCGATKQGILKNLNNLIDMGLIEKIESYNDNIRKIEYRSTELNSIKLSLTPIKLSLTNNIDNTNISTNIDILDNINNTNVLFIQKPKQKRKNLYEKCYDEITERYKNDSALQNILIEYLKMSLERKDEKRLKGYAQWKSLLNKLDTLQGDKIAIVNQSIKKYWATFVEVKQYKYINGKLNEQDVHSVVASQEEKEQIERWQKENAIESF